MKEDAPKPGQAPDDEQGRGRPVSDDVVVRFILKYQRALFVCALLLLAGYYVYQRAQKAYSDAMSEAADLYAEARDELMRVEAQQNAGEKPAVEGKKEEQESAKLREKLQALQNQKEPYGIIAGAYSALLDLREGKKVEEREKDLERLLSASSDRIDAADFIGELKAMLVARAMLDDEASRQKGMLTLARLAEKGNPASVSAALTLADVAKGEEERRVALTALEALREKKPVHAELLDGEIERLK